MPNVDFCIPKWKCDWIEVEAAEKRRGNPKLIWTKVVKNELELHKFLESLVQNKMELRERIHVTTLDHFRGLVKLHLSIIEDKSW